ncbi:MAG: ornithine carbamoyltransferase [Chloroflexi bacterium]|nr:ornithine carbamoyltransferase [Chloroflexota bacterium]
MELRKKHFLDIVDYTPEEIDRLLVVGQKLKEDRLRAFGALSGKTLGLLFEKPSLRTRVSFDVGMQELGGHAIYLSPQEIGLGTRESVPDVARVISRFADAVVIRTFAQETVEQFAKWASICTINGLTDASHPCQALADILTITQKFGHLQGINIAYIGDGNNVIHSLMLAAAKMGANVAVAGPKGYEPDPQVVARAGQDAAQSGSRISITTDPLEAVDGADVIYTDVWTSMGQEAEYEKRLATFQGYQVTQELVAHAKPSAIVMHDLPAHRGEEIADDVIDGEQSAVFDQAENRLHAQKSVLLMLMAPTVFETL